MFQEEINKKPAWGLLSQCQANIAALINISHRLTSKRGCKVCTTRLYEILFQPNCAGRTRGQVSKLLQRYGKNIQIANVRLNVSSLDKEKHRDNYTTVVDLKDITANTVWFSLFYFHTINHM